MKPKSIEMCQCDYCLLREKSDNSIYFLKRCIIVTEDYEYPFGGVTLKFVPDRLTRRPMVAMIQDLIDVILEDDVNSEHIGELAKMFLSKLD